MDILREFADVPPSELPPKNYTFADTVYSLVSLILGVVFVRLVMLTTMPAVGITVFAFCCTSASLLRFAVMRRRITSESLIWAVSTLAFGSIPSFVMRGDAILIATLLSGLSFLMLCIRGGYASDSGYLLVDALKALFMPFARMFSFFPSLVMPFVNGGKKSRRFALAFCGIICALIPTCVAAFLLMRADSAFEYVMDSILNFIIPETDHFLNWVSLILGIPCGLYIFGAFFASTDLHETDESRESCRRTLEGARFVDSVFCVASLAPLCFIYLVFFFSQLGYFTSAFTSTLPEGFSVADYARRGFFDLCSVAGLNGFIIFIALIFTKRGLASKIMLTLISVFTLGLAAIALAKMAMYIERWGLTVNRLYPTVFIIILALCFVLVILSLWKPIKLVMLCAVVSLSGVFTLLCADPDRIVGSYNADRYIEGTLDSLDLYLYRDMTPTAAVYLIPLMDDPNYGEAVTHVITEKSRLSEYLGNGACRSATYNFRAAMVRAELEAALASVQNDG